MEKLNSGNITASKKGNLEFSFDIKKEELEKFFNSYLHLLGAKNREKDILLVGNSDKSDFLLHKIKDVLTYFNQPVSITDASTLSMAKMLLKNHSFGELIYLIMKEKNKTYNIIITKGKKKIKDTELFDIIEKMNYYNPKTFNVSRCSYIKNDISYNHKIVQIINSMSLILKDEKSQNQIKKCVYLETENSFIKNEIAKIYVSFGLNVCEKNDKENFIIKIDDIGENIEKIQYKNQILERSLYLKYLKQKEIEKKFKIYIKNENIYFICNNLPIISNFGKKIKDVLCEVYLIIMLSDNKDFLEYLNKNNYILKGD